MTEDELIKILDVRIESSPGNPTAFRVFYEIKEKLKELKEIKSLLIPVRSNIYEVLKRVGNGTK